MSVRPGYAGTLRTRLLNLSIYDPVTGCWNWIGARIYNRKGKPYGSIKVDGKSQLAHRVSVKEFTGRALPKNKVGAHQCNNTLCICPDHLDGQSQKKNMKYWHATREGRVNFNGVAPCITRFV
jgi:hypothetical protein